MKKTSIQQATIAKITIKATGYTFYQIKSDSSNEYYQLHMNAEGQYKCNCPAHKPCKHERALNEILDIQVAQIFSCDEEPAVAPLVEAPAAFPELVCPQITSAPIFEVPARIIPDRERGALNGNRGFSLMR